MQTIKDIIEYVKLDMSNESFMCADLHCDWCKKEHWCFFDACFLALDYLYKGEY